MHFCALLLISLHSLLHDLLVSVGVWYFGCIWTFKEARRSQECGGTRVALGSWCGMVRSEISMIRDSFSCRFGLCGTCDAHERNLMYTPQKEQQSALEPGWVLNAVCCWLSA